MKKKLTLLMASLAFLLGSSTVWGQHGVLLPQNQEESVPACSCGFDHGDDGLHVHQATPEIWPHYPLIRSTSTNQVTPRRGNSSNPGANFNNRDTIWGPNDVNLLFGAGESSVINGMTVVWPASGGAIHNNSLLIGSDYSKNAVMAIADLEGLATGALRKVRFYQQGHGSKNGTTAKPDTVNKASFNVSVVNCGPGTGTQTDAPYYLGMPSASGAQHTSNQLGLYIETLSYDKDKDPLLLNLAGTVPPNPTVTDGYNEVKAKAGSSPSYSNWAAGGGYVLALQAGISAAYWPFKDPGKKEYHVSIFNNHASPKAWSSPNAFVFTGATADTLYTSTKDATKHDDGQPLLHVIKGPRGGNTTPYDSVLALKQYYRPTTILLPGQNTLDAITVGDVQWYAAYMQGTVTNTHDVLLHAINPGGCCHFSGWVSYYRDDVEFSKFQVKESNRFVDAAVRILDGADVCVKGNVKDNTTTTPLEIGYSTYDRTDAILVLPGADDYKGDRSNFRLKIGGDADILHTQDSGYTIASDPLNYGYLYSDAASGTGPGDPFPTAQTDINLSEGTNKYTEIGGMNWTGYEGLTHNTGSDTEWKPYASTYGSVYGVRGSYMGGTDIHTRTIGGKDTTSIIQIGSTTNNQDRFKIYSAGMLKNFRSTCAGTCDSLVLGRGGLAPGFYLSNTMPLYIINDGNGNATTCCDAGIAFHTAGVDSLNKAVEKATGIGDLHIQAHSFVNMYDNIDFNTTFSNKDNNVTILSDNAYINTKGFDYTGGTGNLNLWTKGTPTDMSGCGGYIFIAGAVNIKNSGTKADGPVLFGTVPGGNTISISSCITPTDQAAFNVASLDTKIQTRIQSDNDSVSISGLYTHNNLDAGALLVQGELKVNFQQGATITLTGGTADVAIQSKSANVEFGDLLTYVGDDKTDLFIDGETGVTFSGGSITQPTATPTNIGIQSNNGTILFKDAPFAFDVTNTDYVQVWAGRNINIRNALTYDDHTGTGTHVHFFAKDSLLTNAHWTGAPVTFTVGNTNLLPDNTLTDWISGANMHTSDRVTFNYGSTGKHVDNLTLKSLGANITMDRPVNIAYDSENSILLSAELDCAERNIPINAGYNTAGTGGNRNIQNGNILLNDSVNILRNNTDPGETDILAKYNIRTAMVTMEDKQSTGNNTTIASHMGDIFLGYSAVGDGKTVPAQSAVSYDLNRFVYKTSAANATGMLKINAGFDDQTNANRDGGGNIYFTHIDANMGAGGTHPTEIRIPYSNEYFCNSAWSGAGGMLHQRLDLAYPNAMMNYEHAGIIGGVGRCGTDNDWAQYAPSVGPGTGATDTSLIYLANHGDLLLDAGTRGNIIMNRGSFLNFQNNNANGFFLTRYGDVDMRYATDVQKLEKSVLFLASSELANKLNVEACHCDEQRNNVYLQDFQFDINGGNGSIFVGADNNIKLQYGGLRNIGTQRDPFLSENTDYPCGTGNYHCDSDPTVNLARDLILNFNLAATSGNGGFAAVSSDLVDVYKNLVYNGGTSGQGMSSVPKYGSLHGENVAGYGLYIKTQANKKNWNKTDHGVNSDPNPLKGAACDDQECYGNAYLHQTARVTFHADARLYAENQKVLISSPVLETFGNADYNTHLKKGGKTSITIQADSLIYHDSLIIDGPKTQFSTWSGLYRDMPVIRLGHQRFTPPIAEEGVGCKGCFTHPLDPYSSGNKALDTVFVTFRNDATVNRLHTLVAEHAVISFLTDSFDHQKGNPTLNAKFFTDTFKIRNHVELFNTPDRTHDGHFELVSETQMGTKDYAGIYSRHLHMEPIAPSCSRFGYSQLWMQDHALDVITSSTFGGFGWLHADVHVENDANLFPGYASLRHDGNCYEQQAGILKMQDLRLDKGANLTFSLGDNASTFVEKYECDKTFETTELGRYADCLDVDSLTIYGSVQLDVVIRPEGLILNEGESRCFPVIRYNSVQDGVINHLKMNRLQLTSKDHPSIEGTYYLTLDADTACNLIYICIATIPDPVIRRPVNIPEVAGVTSNPTPGTHYVRSGSGFSFKLKFDSEPPLKVLTGRIVNGQPEELFGTKNANGEYEYVLYNIRGPIQLSVGPDYATDPNSNETIEGALVWAYNNTIYIKVDRADIASIYSVAGQLVKQIELPEGNTLVPMDRGVYIVTLKDGSVHKVIIR